MCYYYIKVSNLVRKSSGVTGFEPLGDIIAGLPPGGCKLGKQIKT